MQPWAAAIFVQHGSYLELASKSCFEYYEKAVAVNEAEPLALLHYGSSLVFSSSSTPDRDKGLACLKRCAASGESWTQLGASMGLAIGS